MRCSDNQHEGRSPRFFAEKGFSQLIMGAGFDTGLDAGQWLRTNPDVPRIDGVFAFGVPSLEEFARKTWGGDTDARSGDRPVPR